MDLLDLYHAHDFSQIDKSTVENEIVNFKIPDEAEEVRIIDSEENTGKVPMKKAKFVPWEPYKAAVAPQKNLSTKCPIELPQLIAYSIEKSNQIISDSNNSNPTPNIGVVAPLKDSRRQKHFEEKKPSLKSDQEKKLEDELRMLKSQLVVEKNVNSELKRLMIATLNDELQNQVEALTEDKVILAHRVDEYMGKLQIEDEEADKLKIDRDVWKCKFLAQSIRCDELVSKNEFLLKTLIKAQNDVKNESPATSSTYNFINLNLQNLFTRSPCEQRIRPPSPKFANLTITCCKNCSGREIHLL